MIRKKKEKDFRLSNEFQCHILFLCVCRKKVKKERKVKKSKKEKGWGAVIMSWYFRRINKFQFPKSLLAWLCFIRQMQYHGGRGASHT